MKGNYDNVAPFYDLLSRLVYGDAILKAHRFLVNFIPANSSILIIGGGTGQILEEISKKHTSGLQITYVDISKRMIERSKKRCQANNSVQFINESIADVIFHQQFDAVITPFFFDNFSDNDVEVYFNKLNICLKQAGLWLFCDFELSKKNILWQQFLLKSMYLFFKLLCGIEASHLPDTPFLFEKNKYKLISKQTFFRKFICSSVYLKSAEKLN